MAINLNGKVSQADADRMRDIRNPPEHEPGFEPQISDDDFGDIFDDLNGSDFGTDNSSNNEQQSIGFGNNQGGQSGFGGFGGQPGGMDLNGGFNQNNGFGQMNGFNQFNGFGQPGMIGPQNQAMNQPQKESLLDKTADASEEALKTFWLVLVELFKSLKNRNADDFGYLSRNLILSGIGCMAGGLILRILGAASGASALTFSGLPIQFVCGGLLTLGAGLTGIGFSAIKIAQSTDEGRTTIQELPDVSEELEDDASEDYEDNLGSIMDDLFGSTSDDDLFGDSIDTKDDTPSKSDELEEPVFARPEKVDFKSQLDKVTENAHMSRAQLFNTFKSFFPYNTPTFADVREISEDEDLFNELSVLSMKALCNVARCEMEDLKSRLESAKETYFSFELKLKRIKGIKNTDDIAREMEAYFRSDSGDTSVNADVAIEGDNYKVTISKGVSAVVTFGDVFKQQYACDFFLDEGNKLPIITGISELGEVILDDAKIFDTMLIAGKPRSGKSWYVFSILMAMAMFNTPEDVEFIVVDPKESNLFNTFALLPHVVGLHNDEHILEIMDDIITNEGARRKKLLADNKCDDIWALRKKGIKLPVLYLVIDEYITVRNNLGDLDKELDNKLQIIISQLPSQGIRLLFVPHRATGVVNKTNRTMLQYTVSVKGDIDDVKDTLGISKWTRALTKPGDLAIKASSMQNAMYLRGAAITTSDEENAELMRNVAKAFYKMGVDMLDMSTMKIACNRNEEFIRRELHEDGNRIQYSNFDEDI